MCIKELQINFMYYSPTMRNTQLVILFLFCACLEVRGQWGDSCPKPGYPGPARNKYSREIIPSQIKCFVLTLSNVYTELTLTSSWLDLDCNEKAVVIYHGAMENSTKPWVRALQKVYVSKYNTCAVACDYTAASLTSYPILMHRDDDKVIAKTTADLIYEVIVNKGGVNLEKDVTLVGFSWGAQIAGLTSSRLKELTGKTVGLIVDSICDHVTSHDYFIDALQNPTKYVGYSCTQCPYRDPSNPSAISSALSNYCKKTTVSVLAENRPCVAENVYVLPIGCVPPNK